MKKIIDNTKNIFNIIFIIVFTVVFINLMISSRKIKKTSKVKEKINSPYQLIDNNNYLVNMKLHIDDDIYYYKGYKNKERYYLELTKEGDTKKEEYIIFKDFALLKKLNNYTVVKIPYIGFNYFDTDLIKNLINKGVKDKDGSVIIKNLYLFNKNDEYHSELTNKIDITYQNNYVTGYKIDFSNFIKDKENKNKMLLDIKYYDFNKAKDININIE